jgi:hypothetical protein
MGLQKKKNRLCWHEACFYLNGHMSAQIRHCRPRTYSIHEIRNNVRIGAWRVLSWRWINYSVIFRSIHDRYVRVVNVAIFEATDRRRKFVMDVYRDIPQLRKPPSIQCKLRSECSVKGLAVVFCGHIVLPASLFVTSSCDI